jgi:hypothetical protein
MNIEAKGTHRSGLNRIRAFQPEPLQRRPVIDSLVVLDRQNVSVVNKGDLYRLPNLVDVRLSKGCPYEDCHGHPIRFDAA